MKVFIEMPQGWQAAKFNILSIAIADVSHSLLPENLEKEMLAYSSFGMSPEFRDSLMVLWNMTADFLSTERSASHSHTSTSMHTYRRQFEIVGRHEIREAWASTTRPRE
jgi:hypothetical protein